MGFLVIEGNLWSPLNQISTRDSALILELEVKWFKPIDALSCVSGANPITMLLMAFWKTGISAIQTLK